MTKFRNTVPQIRIHEGRAPSENKKNNLRAQEGVLLSPISCARSFLKEYFHIVLKDFWRDFCKDFQSLIYWNPALRWFFKWQEIIGDKMLFPVVEPLPY